MIVTLRLWLPEELNPYGGRPGSVVLAQQLADFSRAYPDLQVEVIVRKTHGRGGLLDFLRTARLAAPSVLPDLVVLDAADLAAASGSDLVQPLDDLLSPAAAMDRFPFAIAMGQVQTRTMGLVLGVDTQYLAYRTSLFDSPVDEPAIGAFNMISWTQVISAPSQFVFPAAGVDRRVNDATLIQYLGAGGQLADAEGKPQIDRAVMLRVMKFYSECVDTGVISPALVLDLSAEGQAWELFKEGVGGLAVVPATRYWREADETMAFAPVPTQDRTPVSIVRGWTISMVSASPSRQRLAVLLLDWLMAHDHNAEWSRASGYLPGTRGALQLWDVSSAERAMMFAILENARPLPQNEVTSLAGIAMQEGVVAFLSGRATPEEAAGIAVETLTR